MAEAFTCLLALTDVLTILLPQLAGAELDAQRRRRVRGSALYPSEESLRELGISGPTLLHCSDQDA